DQDVPAGTSAQFTVTASGAPRPEFQWSFNGDPLDGQTDSTLTLTDVHASMAGGYSVIVSNSFGSMTSTVATLTVLPSRTLALTSPLAGQEGTTISVPLELISEGDVGGLTFVLHYDPDYLSNGELGWSPLLEGLFNTINYATPGEIHATFAFSG